VLLGSKGIEKILEISLEPAELELLTQSAEDVRNDIERLDLS
jgi:malate/lactate dehydrogenase